jgi:hypothetical protein
MAATGIPSTGLSGVLRMTLVQDRLVLCSLLSS